MRVNINNREGNMKIKRRVFSLINYTKFIYFLCKGIFMSDSEIEILRVVQKFVSLQYPFYSKNIVMGRKIGRSYELLNALINSYIKTKSETTLNQIMVVLKEEFIKRSENNGRKQF